MACTKLLCLWDFLGKSTGVGCHFLFQGIFPTQGSNPGLQHCRQTLHHLSHQGSPPLKRNTAIQLIRKTTCITKYICFLNYKHNECSLKKSWTVQKGMLILSLSRTKQHYKNVLELLSVNFDAYIVPLHTHFSFLFFSFFFFLHKCDHSATQIKLCHFMVHFSVGAARKQAQIPHPKTGWKV